MICRHGDFCALVSAGCGSYWSPRRRSALTSEKVLLSLTHLWVWKRTPAAGRTPPNKRTKKEHHPYAHPRARSRCRRRTLIPFIPWFPLRRWRRFRTVGQNVSPPPQHFLSLGLRHDLSPHPSRTSREQLSGLLSSDLRPGATSNFSASVA